jgi:hypothetical protein
MQSGGPSTKLMCGAGRKCFVWRFGVLLGPCGCRWRAEICQEKDNLLHMRLETAGSRRSFRTFNAMAGRHRCEDWHLMGSWRSDRDSRGVCDGMSHPASEAAG